MSVVCKGKKESKEDFIKDLSKFISDYQSYEISKQAQNMVDYLTVKKEVEKPSKSEVTDSSVKKSRYVADENSTHFFICLYPGRYSKTSELKIAFSDYNKQYFELASLEISTMLLNKENQMLIVKQFHDNNYISRINQKLPIFILLVKRISIYYLKIRVLKRMMTFSRRIIWNKYRMYC